MVPKSLRLWLNKKFSAFYQPTRAQRYCSLPVYDTIFGLDVKTTVGTDINEYDFIPFAPIQAGLFYCPGEGYSVLASRNLIASEERIIRACVAHERGHLDHRWMTGKSPTMVARFSRSLVNELYADFLALNYVSIADMLHALLYVKEMNGLPEILIDEADEEIDIRAAFLTISSKERVQGQNYTLSKFKATLATMRHGDWSNGLGQE